MLSEENRNKLCMSGLYAAVFTDGTQFYDGNPVGTVLFCKHGRRG
jgi:hypothetical protein